mgnify:CR=1 FL=1
MKTETQQKIQLTDHKHRSGMHGLAIVVAVSALMSGCAATGSGGVVEIGPNTTLLPTSVLAQDKELSAEAKTNDANEDGLLQKNEAKYQTRWNWKANFDQIDCDKNGGLDGAEIKWFKDLEECPDQEASAPIFNLNAYPTGSGPFPAWTRCAQCRRWSRPPRSAPGSPVEAPRTAHSTGP